MNIWAHTAGGSVAANPQENFGIWSITGEFSVHILRPTLATSTNWLRILSLKEPYFNSKHLKNKTKEKHTDFVDKFTH